MDSELNQLSDRYQTALETHLRKPSRGRPRPASALGREALALGLKTPELGRIHERAVDALNVLDGGAKRARAFFVEAITPLDESHRLAMEANAKLKELRQTLRKRTAGLAGANVALQREILRRKASETSCEKSEERHRQLLVQSRLMHGQLRHLSQQILLAQEEERKEISRELHDDIAQTLSGINVHLETLSKEAATNTQGLTRKITRTQQLVTKSVNIVHRFARELRPTLLDDLGLVPALHSYAKEWHKRNGIPVQMAAFAGVEQLSDTKRTVLYRVTQAALTNVAQHAKATHVKVSIRKTKDGVRLEVHDDGKAFDVERVLFARRRKRLGLLGMRERVEMVGGTFTVKSAPGEGTTIWAEIPFANGKKQS